MATSKPSRIGDIPIAKTPYDTGGTDKQKLPLLKDLMPPMSETTEVQKEQAKRQREPRPE